MITHVVMMKFKPEVTDEQVNELQAMLDRLPDIIYEIQSYDFGRDVVRSERSYDFALISVFANLEMLDAYRVHPEHQKVVKKLTAMCADIVAVDYENSPYLDADKEPDPLAGRPLFQRP